MDPLSIEAPETAAESVALYSEAVRIGMRIWQARDAQGSHIDWWGDVASRPYIQAILRLAQALARIEDVDSANRCLKTLAKMDRHDDLGATEILRDLGVAEYPVRP